MKPNNKKGFTIIELLVVITILGILSAIAIPLYLGHRERARVAAIESSAKGAVSEIKDILFAYTDGDPYIVLDNVGVEICVQSSIALGVTGKTCDAIYNTSSGDTYSTLDDVIQHIINHHEGKKEASPLDPTQYLFVSTPGFSGTIVIEPSGGRAIRIRAYALDTSPIFETTVRAR